jgi:predicted GNAT family acetyltransferase
VVAERGFPAREWEQVGRIPLRQWVHDGRAVDVAGAFDVLGAAHAADMYALAKLADPGPFEQDTWRLGAYLGIHVDGTLVAMAGERMRLPGFTEVSAVSTRPGHEGHGYATRLVRALVARASAAGERPFLHVRTGSPAEHAASRVYEKLGFEVRAAFTFQLGRRRG